MTKRGTLKVYLGFAPGVGKTCAMLSEAHDLLADGVNVLVGIVEDHGRERTRRMAEGLPTLPRKTFSHHSGEFTELDVEAALAAQPDVLLVDELAHTVVGTPDADDFSSSFSDATGSPVVDSKRWHDVYRPLDAGIDVISTMNIQHLESLNDVVAAVTGTRQQETVPDQVLRDADEIELVDLTPDALRIRLARGEVYGEKQAEKALENYFRVGNLTALRELALLWLADKVEEVLESYRQERTMTEHLPTRERVVVAVHNDKGAEAIIRRGARITGRMAGHEMIVVHVAGDDDAIASEGTPQLKRLQELTDSLGGQWRVILGDDVPQTLLQFARSVNASQLVIGLGRRISPFFGGGTGSKIIDGSGPIDVHIVPYAEHVEEDPSITARSTSSRNRRWSVVGARPSHRFSPARITLGWAIALFIPFALTALFYALDVQEQYLGALLLSYLTVAVFAALAAGLLPAITAAFLGSLLANWYFSDPIHTFTITEPESVAQILLFFIIAAVVAGIVELSERRRAQATQRLGQAIVMSDLARGMVHDGDDIPQLLQRLRETFGLRRVDLQRWHPNRKLWTVVETTADGLDTPWEGTKPPSLVPIGEELRLVVAKPDLRPTEYSMIEAHGSRIMAIINRQEIDAMRRATAALEAGNRMGTALLTAVSHDLRTPLAGIKAAISGLMMDDVELDDVSKTLLLETIEHSTERLETVVGNLLDMSRLRSNTVNVHHRPVDVGDVLANVQRELPDVAEHLDVDLPAGVPRIMGDAGLIQRIVSNILLNGRAFAPNSRLLVTARGIDGSAGAHDAVEIRIIDHGPGINDEDAAMLFVPFKRLGDQSSKGLGLGLAVAQGFAEAMDGTLAHEHTPGGGATLILTLPSAHADTPPMMLSDDLHESEETKDIHHG